MTAFFVENSSLKIGLLGVLRQRADWLLLAHVQSQEDDCECVVFLDSSTINCSVVLKGAAKLNTFTFHFTDAFIQRDFQ